MAFSNFMQNSICKIIILKYIENQLNRFFYKFIISDKMTYCF